MQVGPVIAVTDLSRARDFYEGALGLSGQETPGGWVIRAEAGSRLFLLPEVSDAGSATWPVASFQVADVREKVRELKDRGVPFLSDDDLPFDLDVDDISVSEGMQVAWMRDPDGSILTIFHLDDSS